MKARLQYGTTGLEVEIPGNRVTVLEPRFVPGLADEAAGFRDAVRAPIAARPLRDLVAPGHRIAVAIPDLTRPFPSARVLPWLFTELAQVPADRFTIIVGTGTHRANTPAELDQMVGADIVKKYRVVNHDAADAATMVPAGKAHDGWTVRLRKEWVEADRRLVLGFIEPHFMAGFSGGYKGVFPAMADLASIMHYHRAEVIGHPKSTWGVVDGNPTQGTVRTYGSLIPADFLINVTLNRKREITRFFCGNMGTAFLEGCAFARETAMISVDKPFPVVVTTNSGFPLDQNLYQAVKGMSAAAQVVAPGGLIVAAARCNDGFPAHGNFKKLLFDHPTPEGFLQILNTPGFLVHDQWEAQLLALIRLKARVALKSELPDAEVHRAWMEPAPDIAATLSAELTRLGPDTPIAILPEGPQTIPYLA